MTDRELLELLLKKFSGVEEQLSGIDKRLSNVESNMATKADIEQIIGEQQKDIKAMLELTNKKLDAKSDELLHNTAAKDSAERIETKIDILTHRVLAQDGEIQLLKKAK